MIKYDLSFGWFDYPDTSQMCVSVYFYGCSHNCDGCHNKSLQDINSDSRYISNTYCELYQNIRKYMIRNRTINICLMGGDPLYHKNIEVTKYLCSMLYNNGFNVMIYTGYTDLTFIKTLNLNFKYLKIGKYNKHMSQPFEITDTKFVLSSKNQQIYNSNYELLSNNGVFIFN